LQSLSTSEVQSTRSRVWQELVQKGSLLAFRIKESSRVLLQSKEAVSILIIAHVNGCQSKSDLRRKAGSIYDWSIHHPPDIQH
jgi:hypothetical protein